MIYYNVEINGDKVVVSKSFFEELLEDQMFLEALQAAGFDNWEGYSHAVEILEDEE